MATTFTKGVLLFNGDPSSATPVAKLINTPMEGRGWAYLHVLTAAHASDTATVTMKGRLNASGGYVALKQADNSTAVSVAQSAGAVTEVITTVQLVPDMIVVLSGTRTAGASTKVWLEAVTGSVRADS